MNRLFLTLGLLISLFTLPGLGLLHAESAEDTKASDASEKPVGGEAGEKGGIYVVGRAFKTTGHTMKDGFVEAGHGMDKGFKAAGRGIKKGGQETGKGFKKAGGSIKNFFTGE